MLNVQDEKISLTEQSSENELTDIDPIVKGSQRKLHARHLRFLALGGSIGTGLFIATGNILSTGGPGSVMINLVILSFMIVTVLFAIGEFAALYPLPGLYTSCISRFLDPSLGFAIGLDYTLTWLIILPVELTAVTIVIGYWDTEEVVPKGVWIVIVMLFVFGINVIGVQAYGEFEVFATSIKMISIIGFIIFSIIVTCGGPPVNHYYGAQYWHDPGAFNNGFKGFCSVFVFGAFSFGGSELIGITAAEAAHPRKQLPRACKMVIYRVLIFFILALFMVTLTVPYDDEALLGSSNNPRASAFVLAIKRTGEHTLASVFNGAILISVISVANSAVYASSRLMVGMSQQKLIPKFMGYMDSKGRPWPAMLLSFMFGCLAFLVYSTSESEVFSWLVGISGLATIFVWGIVSLAHVRFRLAWKAQNLTAADLPWASPLGIYGSIFSFVINFLLVAGNLYYAAFPIGEGAPEETPQKRAHDFFESMISFVVVLFTFILHKLITRAPFVRFSEIDLMSQRRDPVSSEQLQAEKKEFAALPLWKRITHTLF
ncbi:hypothetical protein MVES1_002931 [Malassezia vespertilionis]|uniref:Amino acid permease/ SLC12A domain-containing protein n=1 Tax=Malassezia vespertilionis TaxID=2020962 RepID=A0A2N1J9W4_9BASI|nr:uncharacterized protein MVES1_002931 [Malassezia vespertilionis]PKI83346.1 hypothetical protein MVES_002780 [Malassezia vespertilionis]WFD07564.1 hypothetical protein MVES1_002931 [Malassezia vespertilionis]